jgi:hypothetical protein
MSADASRREDTPESVNQRPARANRTPASAAATPRLSQRTGPSARPRSFAGVRGLLALDVGVGKTYTGIATIAYLRQLGSVLLGPPYHPGGFRKPTSWCCTTSGWALNVRTLRAQ